MLDIAKLPMTSKKIERFNSLPVVPLSITDVSEGVRQETQAAKACVFCF
jgi:hypothetical protein